MSITVTGIRRYPVKSCRGEELDSAVVEPWGLAGDRRWMVVDAAGRFVTARVEHRLLLVHPRIVEDGLELTAPGLPPIHVRAPGAGSERISVQIWSSTVDAALAVGADAWLTEAIGTSARLVHLDDPTLRATDPTFSRPEDRVSFADGYPLLLASQDSLAALDELVAAGPLSDEGPLSMTRFRPSLVVAGAPAWDEDRWRRIRVGGAVFRVVKGCARCVMTTLDPTTAEGGKEPIATLARHRRWDGQTWFAVNLVPDSPGARISVGDGVEVLEAGDPADGPLRATTVAARGAEHR
jgi:uncharacterized protein YcbX